jgi:hypothetical protein
MTSKENISPNSATQQVRRAYERLPLLFKGLIARQWIRRSNNIDLETGTRPTDDSHHSAHQDGNQGISS